MQHKDETTAAAPELGGELLAAYVGTVVSDPTGAAWSGDDALETLPLGECWVITGHNPFSEPRTDAENHAANARLAAVIAAAGAEAVPVDGCAPDHSWCEPAFAVPGEVPAELVRRWAADFDQHAVFHLTDLEHRVVRTGDGATVGVRPRRG